MPNIPPSELLNSDEVTPVADVRPVNDNITPPHTASPSPLRNHKSSDQADVLIVRDPSPFLSDEGEETDDWGEDDDNWVPQQHGLDEPERPKRKRQVTLEDEEDAETIVAALPPRKKPKNIKKPAADRAKKAKPSPKEKRPKIYNESEELDRMANAEQKRLAAPKPNKHLAAMRKTKSRHPVQMDLSEQAHNRKIEALRTHVSQPPPAIVADILPTTKTKFEWQDSRVALVEKQVQAWAGQKWTDEHDPNVTWFIVPASQKYLSVPGRMVSISNIVNKSVDGSEFQHVENIMVMNRKTGKDVVGPYKIRYEKMDPEQAEERMKFMIKQAKIEAAQAKKDERARLARSRRATAPSALQLRRERARTQATQAQ